MNKLGKSVYSNLFAPHHGEGFSFFGAVWSDVLEEMDEDLLVQQQEYFYDWDAGRSVIKIELGLGPF